MPVKMEDAETAVSHVLSLFPETCSNDKLLMLDFWELYDGEGLPRGSDGHPHFPPWFRWWFLKEATTPETIARARRKVQENGGHKARKEVEEGRREKARQLTIFFGKKEWI